MRFVLLTQYFPPEIGAPQTRLAAVARELVRLGHEVEVVTAMPSHPKGRTFPAYRGLLRADEAWEGIPVHRVATYPSVGSGARRALNYVSFAAASLAGLARCRRPDVVLVESPPPTLALPAALACALWDRPFVLNVADLWPDSLQEMGFLRDGPALRAALRFERWAYRRARLVSAVTEGVRARLLRDKGVPEDRTLFLPNGVDTTLFRPRVPDAAVAARLGLGGRRLVLYAGTIGHAHGLDVVLDAAERLRARTDLLLALVGDGSDRARLEAEARRRGLANVVFVDPVPLEELAAVLSVAYAGLATVRGLPIFDSVRSAKVFPVMASARPVVYSGRGEGARLVADAEAGVVVPPDDGAALAEAIAALLDDPARADALGANGRRYAEEHLGWDGLVAAWVEALRAKGVGPHGA